MGEHSSSAAVPADYFPLDALPEHLTFPTDILVLDQLRDES